jgi:SNF2 family DNA or RNA helicase
VERSTYTNFKYYYGRYSGNFGNILIGYKNIDILKDMIDKYSLRRTKDLLDLPSKTIINEILEMTPGQERFYEEIKNGVKEQVDKVKLNTVNLLALTTRLRQATDFPGILTTNSKIESVKIERAIELVDEIVSQGEKVVVFSTFKDTIYELAKRLSKYNPFIMTGDTKDEENSRSIDEFQTNPNRKVFIGTHQKAGTGITLTAARYMIFLSIPWTDANYTQAQDRIYRIGTKNKVTIYHLITKNTIDERVLEIVEDKGALSDYIIDDKISEKGLENLKKYLEEL